MLIGAMNHPGENVISEIEWMGRMGLDFIDLTLEPPAAAWWCVNPAAIREALSRAHLQVVGHTAYYLPIGSPFESIRRASVDELKKCLEIFSAVGAKWMNVHPDRQNGMHTRKQIVDLNLRTLNEALPLATEKGIGLMLENVPVHFNNVAQLADLLGQMPELGLHLDIGHANLQLAPDEINSAPEMIKAYRSRLRHVHLHDNKGGGADLHLALGAGTLPLAQQVRCLKQSGYDGTITLEVFSADRHYLEYSRDILRALWDKS